MTNPTILTPGSSCWPHRWALLTVCAALPLLVLGSLVTTLKAGMADKFWPTHPLHVARADLVAEAERQGYAVHLYVLEHSHRAAGWLVGLLSIVLCAWLWIADRRPWMKWLGTLALAGVSAQGVLGGLRVLFHANYGVDLATLHGCIAQLVFALLVGVALFTSSWWTSLPARPRPRRLAKWTLGTCCLVFGQIIFGAIVRHSQLRLAQRLHFLLAFAVLAAILWLMTLLREDAPEDRRFRIAGHVLAVILVLQLSLGVEAWMMRFSSGVLSDMQRVTPGAAVVRTLHFVFGTLLFASAVVLALLARQPSARPASQPSPRREEVLEGVA